MQMSKPLTKFCFRATTSKLLFNLLQLHTWDTVFYVWRYIMYRQQCPPEGAVSSIRSVILLIGAWNLLRILANPKSQSLMTWCLVMRMFSGLTSRWMHCRDTNSEIKLTPELKKKTCSDACGFGRVWKTRGGTVFSGLHASLLNGGLVAFVVSRWYINCCSAKGKEFLLKKE